jgi:hypothetical protein
VILSNLLIVFCLTRSRRENPAFNYGFFRPNPLVFGSVAWKNEEHAPELIRGSAPEQSEIARPDWQLFVSEKLEF